MQEESMLCSSHIEILNLANTWKNKTKSIKMLDLLIKNQKLRVWCFLFNSFHVIWKISNSNMWTAKHLVQASWTELTLHHCITPGFKLYNWYLVNTCNLRAFPLFFPIQSPLFMIWDAFFDIWNTALSNSFNKVSTK